MPYKPEDKEKEKTAAELREEAIKKHDALGKTEEDIPGYQAPHGSPMHGITIKGEEKAGKGETRLFQTDDPSVKEWMTEEQAKKAGKYWKPSEPEPKDSVQKK